MQQPPASARSGRTAARAPTAGSAARRSRQATTSRASGTRSGASCRRPRPGRSCAGSAGSRSAGGRADAARPPDTASADACPRSCTAPDRPAAAAASCPRSAGGRGCGRTRVNVETVVSVFMAVAPLGVGAPGTTPRAQPSNRRKGKRRRTVPGRQQEVRSGSGNRRARSSRGRDDDAWATEPHNDHCNQRARNPLRPGTGPPAPVRRRWPQSASGHTQLPRQNHE